MFFRIGFVVISLVAIILKIKTRGSEIKKRPRTESLSLSQSEFYDPDSGDMMPLIGILIVLGGQAVLVLISEITGGAF